MQFLQRAGRVLRGASRPTDRLSEFTFRGRLGPIAGLGTVAAIMYFAGGYGESLELLIELCAAYAVAFLVLAGLGSVMGRNPPWSFVLPAAALGCVAGGYAAAAVAHAPSWLTLLDWSDIRREWTIGSAFSAFFIGLSLVTAVFRQREQFEFETRQRLLEARLKMLAARIEPHFLMNTLANLRYLVRSDAAAAYRMLDHLSDFLQGALERSRDLESTLGQEMQLVESYLSIMQIRLGEKLDFALELPETLKSTPFPALLLQTLVENAVTHGIEPADGPGRITIRAQAAGGEVVITVADNGVGFDTAVPAREGLGLQNIRERLAAFFGNAAALEIVSDPVSGTVATVRIARAVG